MKTVYLCENCGRVHSLRSFIFHCTDCEKEICDECMYGWATCKRCAQSKSDEELKERFEKAEA